MRAWPVALVLAAALLAGAAPAHAGGTIFPGGVHEVWGAGLAGEGVAWSTARNGRVALHTAAQDGSGHTAREVPLGSPFDETGSYRLATSERRLAIAFGVNVCRGGCVYNGYSHIRQVNLTAPAGGELARIEPACVRVGWPPQVDVWGDAVAYREPCDGSTVVQDFATGERRSFPEVGDWIRVAGPYVATIEGGELVVRDWTTGAERLRVPNARGPLDVQQDGKVVFHVPRASPGGGQETYWASPDRPEPKLLARNDPIGVRIAADRVALWRSSGGVAVITLDGGAVASSDVAVPHDFDGNRVAYLTSPCAVAFVATWDLQGDAPDAPPGACPPPVLESRVLEAAPNLRWLGVKLRCPPAAELGCRGYLRVMPSKAREGTTPIAERGFAGFPSFVLAPGEAVTARVKVVERGVCRAGRNALRGTLEIWIQGRRDLGNFRAAKRIRTSGLESLLARCK